MLTIYVDGGALNNQNPELRQAYGSMMAYRDDQPVEMTMDDGRKGKHVTFSWGRDTNNKAEYKSFIVALTYAASLLKRCSPAQLKALGDITVKSDSQLVITQVRGEAKVKNADLKPLVAQARDILAHNSIFIDWVSGDTMKTILGH